MGKIYLVRHGQASLGAANYDQLSALGQRQSVRLGEYFAAKQLQFDAVLTGTLHRHAQTWAGIADGAGYRLAAQTWPGLNEYDSEALIAALQPQPPWDLPLTPAAYKQHFRLLRDALTQWMNGVISPQNMPSYSDFSQGIRAVLDHVRQTYSGNVLIVSSGGPIATAVGQILCAMPETTIDLNMQIRNTAVTEFLFTPKRHQLFSFNSLMHLDGPEYADWATYA